MTTKFNNTANYLTKWIELLSPSKKQSIAMTHYKRLDGDKVIVEVRDQKGAYTAVQADIYSVLDANDFLEDFIGAGYQLTRNEYV